MRRSRYTDQQIAFVASALVASYLMMLVTRRQTRKRKAWSSKRLYAVRTSSEGVAAPELYS